MLPMIFGFSVYFFIEIVLPVLEDSRFGRYLFRIKSLEPLLVFVFQSPLITGIWDLIFRIVLSVFFGIAFYVINFR